MVCQLDSYFRLNNRLNFVSLEVILIIYFEDYRILFFKHQTLTTFREIWIKSPELVVSFIKDSKIAPLS